MNLVVILGYGQWLNKKYNKVLFVVHLGLSYLLWLKMVWKYLGRLGLEL